MTSVHVICSHSFGKIVNKRHFGQPHVFVVLLVVFTVVPDWSFHILFFGGGRREKRLPQVYLHAMVNEQRLGKNWSEERCSFLFDFLCYADQTNTSIQAVFTLYWIGFCSISKVVPVQCEQELFCCAAEIFPKRSQCKQKPYPLL